MTILRKPKRTTQKITAIFHHQQFFVLSFEDYLKCVGFKLMSVVICEVWSKKRKRDVGTSEGESVSIVCVIEATRTNCK